MSRLVPLNGNDAHELTRLHMACFPLDQVWSSQSFAELLAFDGMIGWRMEVEGRNVAFILGRIIIDEVELLTLAVSSRHRRSGLGEALVRQFASTAREKGGIKVLLEVSEHNEAAIKLYAKTGFRAISRRWNYYPDGSSAHVLQLDLV